MKTSLNTIKYVLILAGVFLLLAYSISLNIENKFFILDTFWLSNDFFFAIAGGSFASLLVILVCELQKYFLLKRQTEDCIYNQLFALYSQITIIHYNTERQLNDTNISVPYNLIEEVANRGQLCLNNLVSIDYTIFDKYNTIKGILNLYSGNNGMCIRSFLQDSVFLKIAINEDKMEMLRRGRDEIVTSSSPKTNLTLKKIFDDSSAVLTLIENSLDTIDKECKKRYHWNDVKRNMISYEENFVFADLDSFLKFPTLHFESENK